MNIENENQGSEVELSLEQKLLHLNQDVRKQTFDLFLQHASENQLSKEEGDCLIQNLSTLFSEQDVLYQAKIISLYQAFPTNQLKLEDLQFWYYFMDRFLLAKSREIAEKSQKLFDQFFEFVDKSFFLSMSYDFMKKNNVKIIEFVLVTLITKKESFDFTQEIEKMKEVVDKNVSHSKKNIRLKIRELLQILVKEIGSGFLSQIKKLKNEEIEDLKKLCQPQEPVKKQKQGPILVKNFMDEETFLQSPLSSILEKYSQSWCDKIFEIKKWKTKDEKLSSFIEEIRGKRFDPSIPITHLITFANRLMKENIIKIAFYGFKIYQQLSNGLRHHFKGHIRSNLKLILQKLNSRQTPVIQNLLETLSSFFLCLSVNEFYEELKIYNSQRNKDIRKNLIMFMKMYFDYLYLHKRSQIKNFFESFGEMIQVFYQDQDIEIKDLNNELVLYLLDILEESQEYIYFQQNIDYSMIRNLPPKNISHSKTSLEHSPVTSKNMSRSKSPVKNYKDNPLEIKMYKFLKTEFSKEMIEDKIKDILGEGVLAQCQKDGWKEKQEGLNDIEEILNKKDRLFNHEIENICDFLNLIMKGFQENNLILNNKLIDIFSLIDQKSENKEMLFHYYSHFVIKKISEKKFISKIEQQMNSFVEALPFHIIFNRLLFSLQLDKQYSPKCLLELNQVLQNMINSKSTYILDDIKFYFGLILNHSHQEVRKSGITFLKIYCESFKTHLEEIINLVENKTLQTQLKEELGNIIKEPQSLQHDNKKRIFTTNQNQQKNKLQHNPKQSQKDNFYDLIEKLGSCDWQVKKDTLQIFKCFSLQHPEYYSSSKIQDSYNILEKLILDSHRLVQIEALNSFKEIFSKYFNEMKLFHFKIARVVLKLAIDKSKNLRESIQGICNIFQDKGMGNIICDRLVKVIAVQKSSEVKLFYIELLEQHLSHFKMIENQTLFDAAISIISDKDKQIRIKSKKIIESIFENIGEENINQKIMELRPLLKEKVRKISKKVFQKNSLDDIIYVENLKKQQKQIPQGQKKVPSVKSFQSFTEPIMSSYLASVLQFSEPKDIEIAQLHKNLQSIIDVDYTKRIFSFETNTIIDVFQELINLNIYNASNILLFLQFIYIRIYDTSRVSIVKTFQSFLQHIKQVIFDRNIQFQGEKETQIVLNSLVKFFLNIHVNDIDLIIQFTHHTNQHLLLQYCFDILSKLTSLQTEDKMLTFIERVSRTVSSEAFFGKENLKKLIFCQETRPDIVVNIMQNLNRNQYFQQIKAEPEFKKLFSIKEFEGEDQKKWNMKEILQVFENQELGKIKLSNHMDHIVTYILGQGDALIIKKTIPLNNENMQSFLKVIEKLCTFKNLLDCITEQHRVQLFEKFISMLILVDRDKQEYRFIQQNNTILTCDEIIQTINQSIIRLLDFNSPNILYETLFLLLEQTRKNLISDNDEYFFVKFKNCLVKSIFKLTKNMPKIVSHLEIKSFLALLNKYYVLYKDFSEQFYIKTLKTVLSEIAKVMGVSLYDYYEFMEIDQSFLLCLNRFLDREKSVNQ